MYYCTAKQADSVQFIYGTGVYKWLNYQANKTMSLPHRHIVIVIDVVFLCNRLPHNPPPDFWQSLSTLHQSEQKIAVKLNLNK